MVDLNMPPEDKDNALVWLVAFIAVVAALAYMHP